MGLEGEDFVEILTGLELKDEVILSPGNDIENNVRIKPTQVTQSAS